MRGTRIWMAIALLSVLAALMLPASAAGAGPTATKSGVLVNYVSTGKLEIAKQITILALCSANCRVDCTTVVNGPGVKARSIVTGSLTANVPGGPFIRPKLSLLRAMKDEPGKFKLRSTITATNTSTGAVETISRTFGLKR